ncbi:hypothetical protein GFV14_00620 [Candidatus Hartigia pinicola]|nr:hypothetical protein GFV14_00620 [Candidatus Hartigia pinicola]
MISQYLIPLLGGYFGIIPNGLYYGANVICVSPKSVESTRVMVQYIFKCYHI